MRSTDSKIWKPDSAAIKELRLQRDLTISQAASLISKANKVPVHYKTLDKIERGVIGASELMIRRIARGYGVKPDEIKKQVAA